MRNCEVVKLNFPKAAIFSSLPRIATQTIGERLSLSEDQIEDIKLAVGEACTNAIKFADQDSHEVSVLYRIEKNSLEIEVRNAGRPFKQAEVNLKSHNSDLKEGGLGLYLIEQLMDELRIEYAANEVAVTMVKRFPSIIS